MSTEWEQDAQEFIDLRARIKELEAVLQEIHDEATRRRDWDVVTRAVRGVLYPYLSEYLKGEENEQANYEGRGNAGNETL